MDNINDFLKLILFDHKDVDLGSPKLHVTKFFNQSRFRKNVVILAFKRAEMAGGQILLPPPPPPSPGRVILIPIPGRGLKLVLSYFLQLALHPMPLCAL